MTVYFKFFLKTPGLYPFLLRIGRRRVSTAFRIFLRKGGSKTHDGADTSPRRILAMRAKDIAAKLPLEFTFVPDFLCLERNLQETESVELSEKSAMEIRVFGTQMNLDSSLFDENHRDGEVIFFIQRFLWLYDVLESEPKAETVAICDKLIEDWIARSSRNESIVAMDSYSICERTIVWLLFFKQTAGFKRPDTNLKRLVAQSISAQLKLVLNALEFRGGLTNNHILNNARCLYVCGSMFHLNDVAQLGRDLFGLEAEHILIDQWLVEGSSHYHVMLTWNICQMMLVADSHADMSFRSSLFRIVKIMMLRSDSFVDAEKNNYAILGDISPDRIPEAFRGWPFVSNSSRQADCLKFLLTDHDLPQIRQLISRLDFVDSSELAELNRMQNHRLTIWIHLRNHRIPCHGHNDQGNVVIHYDGQPILVDPGRMSYDTNPISIWQISAEAHNLPLINGYSADIDRNSRLFESGIHSTTSVQHNNSNSFVFTVKYANPEISISRAVLVRENQVRIVDTLESAPSIRCVYQSCFNFAGENLIKERNGVSCQVFSAQVEARAPIDLNTTVRHNQSVRYGDTPDPLTSMTLSSILHVGESVGLTINFKPGL